MATKHEKMFYIINFWRHRWKPKPLECKWRAVHVERIWCHLEPTYTACGCIKLYSWKRHFFRWLKIEILLSRESTCICIAKRNKSIHEKACPQMFIAAKTDTTQMFISWNPQWEQKYCCGFQCGWRGYKRKASHKGPAYCVSPSLWTVVRSIETW